MSASSAQSPWKESRSLSTRHVAGPAGTALTGSPSRCRLCHSVACHTGASSLCGALPRIRSDARSATIMVGALRLPLGINREDRRIDNAESFEAADTALGIDHGHARHPPPPSCRNKKDDRPSPRCPSPRYPRPRRPINRPLAGSPQPRYPSNAQAAGVSLASGVRQLRQSCPVLAQSPGS